MSDKVGAWGISYGGGQVWNGLADGVPYKAAEVFETWTDLYSALWPQNIARSGIVAGFARAVAARSPLIAQNQANAIQSLDMGAIRALVAPRSSITKLSTISAPVYMFQGRVDYAFDVTQATNGYNHVKGPKHLYIGRRPSAVDVPRPRLPIRHLAEHRVVRSLLARHADGIEDKARHHRCCEGDEARVVCRHRRPRTSASDSAAQRSRARVPVPRAARDVRRRSSRFRFVRSRGIRGWSRSFLATV